MMTKRVRTLLPGQTLKRTRLAVMRDLCKLLEAGSSLKEACRQVPDAPTHASVLGWLESSTELSNLYTRARTKGYQLLADEILSISDETHAIVEVPVLDEQGREQLNPDGSIMLKKAYTPLSQDVLRRNALRVDTRKWVLAKMLPKVYGDRTVIETATPAQTLEDNLREIAAKLPV